MRLFGNKKVGLGVDISERSIEAVAITISGNRMDILGYGREPLDSGIIEDAKIVDRSRLIKILRSVISSALGSSQKTKSVVITVPGVMVTTELVPFSFMKDKKQIEEEVTKVVCESLELDPANTVINFYVLNDAVGVREYWVFVEAVDIGLFREYSTVFKEVGYQVSGIVFEGTAAATALAPPDVEIPWILIDCGATKTRITAFKGRTPYLSTVVPMGGDCFTLELSKRLKLTGEKAEIIKKKALSSSEAKKTIEPLLKKIAREVNNFRSTVSSQFGFAPEGAILSGGSSMMDGWKAWWSDKLDIDCAVAVPYIKFFKKIPELPLYINAMGLAMKSTASDKLQYGVVVDAKLSEEVFSPPPSVRSGSEEKSEAGQKAVEERKNKLSKGLLFLLIFLVFLFFGGFLFYLYKRGLISFDTNVKKVDIGTGGASVREEIFVDSTFSVGPGQMVEGRILTQEITKEVTIYATGEKEVEGYASGRAIVYNNTDNAIRIVGNSRLLTKNNVLFYTKQLITVPAYGSVGVDIKAAEKGASGDIDPQRLDFPGLADFGGTIYAETKEKLTGGVQRIEYILSEDVKSGLSEAKKLVENSFQDLNWVEKFDPTSEFLFQSLIDVSILSSNCKEEEGKETPESKCQAVFEVKALTLNSDSFKAKTDRLLEESAKEGEKAADYKLKSYTLEMVSYDAVNNKVDVKLHAIYTRKK